MAVGLPVVCSDIGGYRDVVRDGTFDDFPPPLVESRSKNYLTMALEEIGEGKSLTGTALTSALDDGRLRARLVAAAEQRAQQFSMVRLAEAYVERYERLAPGC